MERLTAEELIEQAQEIEKSLEMVVSNIKISITKLRNGTNKEDRDSLEFDINDLNIFISSIEYDYDILYIKLEEDKDRAYKTIKDEIKTDAGIKRYLESNFINEQQTLNRINASVKKYKRLHGGFIKIAEHIKSNIIKEASDIKRNGF